MTWITNNHDVNEWLSDSTLNVSSLLYFDRGRIGTSKRYDIFAKVNHRNIHHNIGVRSAIQENVAIKKIVSGHQVPIVSVDFHNGTWNNRRVCKPSVFVLLANCEWGTLTFCFFTLCSVYQTYVVVFV